MIQSVFIILPAQDNACIFYGQIDEEEDSADLGNILGVIVEYAQRVDNSQVKSIRISQGKFAYGKFDDIYVISKISQSSDMEKVKSTIKSMAKGFLNKYKDQINSKTADPGRYEDFSADIHDYLEEKAVEKQESEPDETAIEKTTTIAEEPEKIRKAKLEKPEIKKSGTDFLRSEKPMKFEPSEVPKEKKFSNETPIIKPVEREAYADGLEDYMKDEVLWNESQEVMNEYTAEFVTNIISKLEVYLSISITHHYKMIIDFQNYPEKPKFETTEDFTDEVLNKVKQKSYFLANWDVKMPPHIIEIVREFEAILSKLKSRGELKATTEMPAAAMPELEPLEKLPPMDDEMKKALKKKEEKAPKEAKKKEERKAQKSEEKGPSQSKSNSTKKKKRRRKKK